MLNIKSLFFDLLLSLFVLMFFSILPSLSMEEDSISIDHINSLEKLRELQSDYPVLREHEALGQGDEGFECLPKEEELMRITAILEKYPPVQGMWIIIKTNYCYDTEAVGRINLSVRNNEVHIKSWLDSRYRKQGFGRHAHSLIFDKITPYLEQEIEYLNNNSEKRSFKFNGIFIDILPTNYGSLVSYLRAGSSIIGYRASTVTQGGESHDRVSSLILHYPIKKISQEKIDNDSILKILKEEVEPYIVNRSKRSDACKELEKLSRDPRNLF